jgi:hypothetical protein
MSGLDLAEGDQPSQAELARKTLFAGLSSEVVVVPSTAPNLLFYSLSAGDGLEDSTLYTRSSDTTQLLPVMRSHKHDSTSHNAGGDFLDVLAQAQREIYVINAKSFSVGEASSASNNNVGATGGGQCECSGTGADISNVISGGLKYVKIDSGTQANTSISTISWGGAKLSFAANIYLALMLQLSIGTDQVFRAGPGMERATAVTNNSSKFGLETCTATQPNWQIVTANSITRTQNTTTINSAEGAIVGHGLRYKVSTHVSYIDSNDNVQTVTTTVPSSGAAQMDKALCVSLAPTNTTDKSCFLSGVELYGKADLTQWRAAGIG